MSAADRSTGEAGRAGAGRGTAPAAASMDGRLPAAGMSAGNARGNGASPVTGHSGPTLITGGAGFVGSNLAHRLLSAGEQVLILDSLARPGVERNLQWLRDTHPAGLQVAVADIRDRDAVADAAARASRVFHFAAQVAVTTSIGEPLDDFEVNALGTLNLLEALRARRDPPPIVFTSTNKVYGALDDVPLACDGQRYLPASPELRAHGIAESRPLDFHSPYGCSKGAADQYVLDYARTYRLPTVVMRMSCIYGPHQFGTEDQGWVAHFLIRALDGGRITLYGDGRQVRDVLYVEDLVDALLLASRHASGLSGRAFNIGGGPGNAISLLDLIDRIESLCGRRPDVVHDDWRTGDQRYYVSDTRRFGSATGWSPRVDAASGIERLYRWLVDARAAGTPAAAKTQAQTGSLAGAGAAPLQ